VRPPALVSISTSEEWPPRHAHRVRPGRYAAHGIDFRDAQQEFSGIGAMLLPRAFLPPPPPAADRGAPTDPARSVMCSLRLSRTLYDLVWGAMAVVVMHAVVMHVMMGMMTMVVFVSPRLNSGRQSKDCARKSQSSKSDS